MTLSSSRMSSATRPALGSSRQRLPRASASRTSPSPTGAIAAAPSRAAGCQGRRGLPTGAVATAFPRSPTPPSRLRLARIAIADGSTRRRSLASSPPEIPPPRRRRPRPLPSRRWRELVEGGPSRRRKATHTHSLSLYVCPHGERAVCSDLEQAVERKWIRIG